MWGVGWFFGVDQGNGVRDMKRKGRGKETYSTRNLEADRLDTVSRELEEASNLASSDVDDRPFG